MRLRFDPKKFFKLDGMMDIDISDPLENWNWKMFLMIYSILPHTTI
jgi:hypothetical protein